MMSLLRAPGLVRGGRKCFLQVPLPSPWGLWHQKKATYVTQQISPSAAEHVKETKHAIDDLFSSEQRSRILQFLNSASEEELSTVKLMQGRKSFNVIDYRDKHGPFQDLRSLLEVPRFQYKTVLKVCNFILNPPAKEETKERKTCSAALAMKSISPEIQRNRLETANSIVSIVFGIHKIAWAHVNRELVVQNWKQHEYTVIKRTLMPAMYFEEISAIVSMIPEADFYVLEKIRLPPTNAGMFSITLHLHIVQAMLYALLQNNFGQTGQHKVVSMTRNAVGKYFGLMLGDVRTSGIDLVKQLLSDSFTQPSRVSFSKDLAIRYRTMLSANKQRRDEELCDSLLQAIAFYELLILNVN